MGRNGNSRRREEVVVDYEKRSIPLRKEHFSAGRGLVYTTSPPMPVISGSLNPLSGVKPDFMITRDVDNNGDDELFGDFGAIGL